MRVSAFAVLFFIALGAVFFSSSTTDATFGFNLPEDLISLPDEVDFPLPDDLISLPDDFETELQATLPGFGAIITQAGLDYGTKIGLEALRAKLNTVVIPDQTGKSGKIKYEVRNIRLSNVVLPSGAIKLVSGTGLSVGISGFGGEVNAKYKGKLLFIKSSGSVRVKVSNVAITTVIKVTANSGKLGVQCQSTSVSIGKFDLHFSGGLSWLLNLIKSLFKGKIKSAVENGIKKAITDQINTKLRDLVATLPTRVPIGKVAELDYSLTSPVQFPQAPYLFIPLAGEFRDLTHPGEKIPFSPAVLPNKPSAQGMLQAYIGEYIPNTASYAFWRAGKMGITIKAHQVPANAPVQLDTSRWTSLVPQLATKYPGWKMSVRINPLSAPRVNFTAKGAGAYGEAGVEVFVVSPTDGKETHVFTVGMSATVVGFISVVNGHITAKLTYASASVWMIKTNVGTFDATKLLPSVKYFTTTVALPYFNDYLKVGLPIPVFKGISLVGPSLTLGNGYILLSTNVKSA